MAEDSRRGGGDDEDKGPGAMFQVFEIMSDLLDKLKLLNFEEHFSRKQNMKPFTSIQLNRTITSSLAENAALQHADIFCSKWVPMPVLVMIFRDLFPRHYFALQTNTGEQFYAFTSLSAWLLTVIGIPFDMPQEFDDPNATISSILEEVKRLGISVDFPPSKLKQGYGEYVCYILDRLTEEALKSSNFQWRSPFYPTESQEEDVIQEEDTAELKLDKLEDEIANLSPDSSDGEEETHFMVLNRQNGNKSAESRQVDILQSNTNADEWKLEVERVTPSLKVTIRTDNKDWRTHVDQMHHHKADIESSLTEAKSHLDKLHDEIGRTLEKISSREKYINNQLEHLVQQYRGAQDQLAQTKEKYRQGSGGVTQLSRSLADVTEDLEKVKHEMEDRGSTMTDGAPLVRIKQSLNRLKTESTQMDIRIGVIEHILMQARLRDKSVMHTNMNQPVNHGEGLERIQECSASFLQSSKASRYNQFDKAEEFSLAAYLNLVSDLFTKHRPST